jgi:signal transduction histidine kinase
MQLVAEAIALVRDVMTDLRPAVLDDYGLEAALESYVEQYKSRYEIDVVLEPPDQPIPRLGLSLEMTLLRIAQEALFNVARHAQADLVNVSLQLQDCAVHLMVQDNGVGFESSQGTNHAGSHGLKIMRERAEAFGGRVDVRSVPGEGTKVEARIPIGNGGQNQVQGETG